MTMTLSTLVFLLLLIANILTLASAVNRAPLWIAVLLVALAALLQSGVR